MNLARLLVLSGLLYAAWRLLRRRIREHVHEELLREQEAQKKEAAAQDVLEEDPLCGVLIPRQQAVRLRQNGTTYYFCSDACCDQFIGKTEGAKG